MLYGRIQGIVSDQGHSAMLGLEVLCPQVGQWHSGHVKAPERKSEFLTLRHGSIAGKPG